MFLDYLDPAFGPSNNFKAEDLYERMVLNARGKPEARFVELGTDLGRSACFMAQVIRREGCKVDFVTVDHFNDAEIETQCRVNLSSYVDAGFIRIERSDSTAFAERYADHSVDFVFIDAGHGYGDVKRDITAWISKIRPGGTLAGDDFWWRPNPEDQRRPPDRGGRPFGVWRAVDECLGGDYEVMVRRRWAIWLKRL